MTPLKNASERHNEDTPQNSSAHSGDIAITGMACIFPGAPNLAAYWHNILGKVDATGDPPDDWEANLFYDPESSDNDRVYCKRGGYLGDLALFNPLQYGVMPNSIDGGEPDQFLALRVAGEALADAGHPEQSINGDRVEVIIGRGTYINRGFTTVVQHGLVVDRVLQILQQLHPEHSEVELQAIKRELKESLPPFNAEMAPALVPNIMSGRIANRLDFMGPNFTVDAACASSLIALDRGLQDLQSHRCDLAVVGGVHTSTPAPILMIFCQLNALSHTGQLRAFDKDADGTLLGEGVGFVVLKRREDAERAGDRIYALIKAIGSSSDGRALGLLAPRLEGEELALRRAYDLAGISPDSVRLIEAHGTGTPVGDLTEIQALTRVFGLRSGEIPLVALGTVKSMISHLIPAAGIAGVIKTALALYHKVLPPTLHVAEPNPAFELEKTPFYLNTEPKPWVHGGPAPRRAGVNAFGFGGINAHAIMEEHPGPAGEIQTQPQPWYSEMFLLQGDSRSSLVQECRSVLDFLASASSVELKNLAFTLNTRQQGSAERLAVVASSPEDLRDKLNRARLRLAEPACARIRDRSGIYFFAEPIGRAGRLAFIFPGEGSQYVNMFADLCLHFPEIRDWFDLIDRAYAGSDRPYLPSQVIFPPPLLDRSLRPEYFEAKINQMDLGPEALFAANQAMFTLLSELGLRPHVVAGHSTGEYSALFASRANQNRSESQIIRDMLDLNRVYEQALSDGLIPEGELVAVGGVDREMMLSLIAADPELYLAMDNCPNQLVLCGGPVAVQRVVETLQAAGAICLRLPFSRAYHTPLFQPFAARLAGFFEQIDIAPPEIELYSCLSAAPFPPDPQEIRRLVSEQWHQPVRFRETIEAMYAAGVRLFVEVGPKNNLTAFVDDILRGRPYLAVPANLANHSGIEQLHHLLAQLAAHDIPLHLEPLYNRRAPRRLELDKPIQEVEQPVGIRLHTGLQPLHLKTERPNGRTAFAPVPPLDQVNPTNGNGRHPADNPLPAQQLPTPQAGPPVSLSTTPGGASDRVMQAYLQTMEQFLSLQKELMQAYLIGRPIGNQIISEKGRASEEELPPAARIPANGNGAEPEACPVENLLEKGHTPAPLSETPDQVLLRLIQERTGYPLEMLQPALNLEADLGIDSIKRVEILGLFQQQTGLLPAQDLDRVTDLKTIQQLLDFIEQKGDRPKSSEAPSAPLASPSHQTPILDPVPSLPLAGRVESILPGQERIATREIDMHEDEYLQDHVLGRRVSPTDPALHGLPVVPLTFSMEMLAEAAASLYPGKIVTGMKEIRAYRWIAIDSSPLALQVVSRRTSPDGTEPIEVHVGAFDAPTSPGEPPGAPYIEGTILLAGQHPLPPAAEPFSLKNERPSRWIPEELYTGVMFHGPRLQGVATVDRWGENGTEGTLVTLPVDGLFRSSPSPQFLTDPVLLDATGQLIGFWTAEHLERGFHVFPFRVETVRLYRSNLPPGERVRCQIRISLTGADQIRSDIQVLGPDGSLIAALDGWWDKRFDLPDSFFRLRTSPQTTFLSKSWPSPLSCFADPGAFASCLLDDLSHEFLEAHGKIWQRVLAYLILSRKERESWHTLPGPDRRRTEWLLGRAAAKDAVRRFLHRRYRLDLAPAEIEIRTDEHGRPQARGIWAEKVERLPFISITHSKGVAAAIAGNDGQCRGVGIDLEPVQQVREALETVAFSERERKLLTGFDPAQKEEWLLRFWCAKEAVAKAHGLGMVGLDSGMEVQQFDLETGEVQFTLHDSLRQQLPQLVGGSPTACTAREGEFVFASAKI